MKNEECRKQLTAGDMIELLKHLPPDELMFTVRPWISFRRRQPIYELVWTLNHATLSQPARRTDRSSYKEEL